MAIARSSFFLALATISARASVVLAGIMIARVFGAEAFAVFAFVHVTASSISNIAMLGMINGLPRFIALMQADLSAEALSRAMLAISVVMIGLPLAVLVVALVPSSMIGLPQPAEKPILIALIVTIGLNNLLMGANIGLERFQRIMVSAMTLSGMLVGGVMLAISLDKPDLALSAYLTATLSSVLILLSPPLGAFRIRLTTQTPSFENHNVKAVADYIGPMFLVTMMTNIGLWIAGRSLLGHENGTQAFAEFALGLQWFGLAQISSNVVSKVVLPRLTRSVFYDDKEDQNDTLRKGVALSVCGAIVVLVVVALMNPFILSLYGPQFSGAQWPLILFVAAAVVASPISIICSAMIANNQYFSVLGATTMWCGVVTIGSTVLGSAGASIVSAIVAISYLVFLSATLWLYRKPNTLPKIC